MFMDQIYYKWLANELIEKQSKTSAVRMNVKLRSGTMWELCKWDCTSYSFMPKCIYFIRF